MYIGYIYRHWLINDKGQEKSYIGQVYSSKGNANPQRRWGTNGKRYAPKDGDEPTKFYKAIDKYGWENFQHKVLFSVECDTLEELVFWLDEWEKYYIEKYDSFYNGYNSTTGGSNGKIYSEESKRKSSESQKRLYENGYISPRFGVSCEEETKKKMSESHKGKQLSEETKHKISKRMKGENNPKAKTIICLETLQIFTTIKEAGEWCGVVRTSIKNHLRGGSKSAGKHPITGIKLHWQYYEDYLKLQEQQNSDNSDSTTNVA